VLPKSHFSFSLVRLVFANMQYPPRLLHPESKHTQMPSYGSCSVHEKQRLSKATRILMNPVLVFLSALLFVGLKRLLLFKRNHVSRFLYLMISELLYNATTFLFNVGFVNGNSMVSQIRVLKVV
jgi:hypothetical protein